MVGPLPYMPFQVKDFYIRNIPSAQIQFEEGSSLKVQLK